MLFMFQQALHGSEQTRQCCLCCAIGPINLEATLERSAYCCGENVKLKAEIQNGSDQNVWLIIRLIQVSSSSSSSSSPSSSSSSSSSSKADMQGWFYINFTL